MRKIHRCPLSSNTQTKLTGGPEYNIPGVKKTLEKMQDFHGTPLCCYCENKLVSCSFHDIEHVKPKSIYPQYEFDWENLLLACSRCNRSYKNDNYEEGFLNPSDDDYSFEDNFDFNEECFYVTKNDNAKLTCDIIQLNERDKHSFKSRLKLMRDLQDNLEMYKNNGLSINLIRKYLEKDLEQRGELDSFGHWLLEKILN